MEAARITWSTDTDELRIIAQLLQQAIKSFDALQTMPNVIVIPASEAVKYDLMVTMYNQIVAKL